MNGEVFYQEFKHALAAVGASWSAMASVEVTLRDGVLRFSRNGCAYEVQMEAIDSPPDDDPASQYREAYYAGMADGPVPGTD